jgi:hypothetical protein
MKKNLNLFLIITVLLFLYSCKKESNDDVTPPDNLLPPVTLLSKTIEIFDAYEADVGHLNCFFTKLKDSSYTIVYNGFESGFNFYMVNYSQNGLQNWRKDYPFFSYCESFDTASDNGYLVTFKNRADFRYSWLIKFNQQGDTLWTKTFYKHYYCKVKELSNGDICLASITNDKPEYLFLNSDGDSIKSVYIADTLVTTEWGLYTDNSLRITSNGNLIFFNDYLQSNYPSHYTPYCCITETDLIGNIVWQKTIPYGLLEVNINGDGSMLCCSNDILHLSPTAEITGVTSLSNTLDNNGSVLEMSDGNYLFGSDKLYKIDPSGNILWSRNFLSDMKGHIILCAKLIDNHDGTYYMFGYYGTNHYYCAIVIRFKID